MIFGGLAAYDSKHRWRLEHREVYTAKPATPTFLDWSRSTITFDQFDHPERVLQPGRYPIVIDPIVSTKRLTKLKLSGPNGVMTVGTSFEKAYVYDVECCEYATTITCTEDPAVQLAGSAEDPPNSKQLATSFEATEGVKEVPLDPSSTDGRTVRIGATLSPK
nr:uncharacterized protein LOC117863675 [Setaria viridis]